MKILVTGASGFIGGACRRVFERHQVSGTYRATSAPGLTQIDLVQPDEIGAFVADSRPDAIVHCAARSSVDWCEENVAEARKLNVVSSANVLRAANSVNARMIFISTDYVFDGMDGPYNEEATVHPVNVYGQMKLEVERALLADGDRHLVVRTTNVYGYQYRSKNFLMALLPRLAQGERVAVAEDQFGTPVHVEDLCQSLRLLVEGGVSGLVHVAGPDLVNRVEWLQSAAKSFGLDPALVAGQETNQLTQAARRPLRAGLRSSRLSRLGFPSPRGLQAGLTFMAAEKRRATEQAW